MSSFLGTHVKVLCNVLAGLVQLVLVQDDVEHFRRTLRQLLSRHQLHVDVPRLGLEEEQQHVLQRSIFELLKAFEYFQSNHKTGFFTPKRPFSLNACPKCSI